MDELDAVKPSNISKGLISPMEGGRSFFTTILKSNFKFVGIIIDNIL